MTTVGAYEAKTHLSELIERVQKGETIVITKHGTAVAELVPVGSSSRQRVRDAIVRLREFQKTRGMKGVTVKEIREMIHEGHKY